MADSVTIFSQNCQGLGDVHKRRCLFRHVRLKNYNIVCLQDIHLQNQMANIIKNEWGFENVYISGFNNNARGVMIMMNNNFEHTVGKVKTDPNGNFIILDLSVQGKKVTLVNLYGPNVDKPSFYTTIKQIINTEFDNEYIIMCGDWNLVLQPDIDTKNYLHINNPRARQEVLRLIDEDNFVDVWRIMHENERCFTWSRRNPVRKQARLDFFLVNDNCLPYVNEASINSGFKSDHSCILLVLKLHDNERGRGYWKFNNSLLKDDKYIQIVKDTIKDVKSTYKTHGEENINYEVNSENISFNINDQLFLETLLLMIRGNTIQYSSLKKKKSQEEEKRLEREVNILEAEVNANFLNISEEVFQELDEKKRRLNEILKEKTDGVMLRSRCRYEELGGKPTKYFFHLEKRNFTSKVINKLVDDNGSEYSETRDILNCQKEFYKCLYSENIEINDVPVSQILGNNPNKLSNIESEKLEGEITYEELAKALKHMKNNKSPGLDGFTVEFF